MSGKGALKKGSVVRLGMNGRLVYVQNVTRYVAYVISFPEQHDTAFDLDRRFLGPPHAISTSPYIDFYTVDIKSLSSRNLDFLESITDGLPEDHIILPGVSKLTFNGKSYKSGDVLSLTPLQALTYGPRAVARYDPNAENPIIPLEEPKTEIIDAPPPLRLEPVSPDKLGKTYLKIYETIKSLGKPTLEEAAKATMTTTLAQAEWNINFMVKLGNLKWSN